MKDPIRARALSNCENRGMPTHKQNRPESSVPGGVSDMKECEQQLSL